jgi:phage terminase large subunit-like protein
VKRTGNRAVGQLELLAYERQLRDLRSPPTYLDDEGVEHHYRFSWKTGNRVVKFFEQYLRFHKGEWAGRPFKLQRWQKFIVRTAFGWKRQDGTRRFRTIFVEIARKNGKSEKAGRLGLYLACADNEPGAEVYTSATKKDQARIVWKVAAKMVRASPELSRFVEGVRPLASR